MAKLLEADLFRSRYFERAGPTDEELRAEIEAGKLRGSVVCGRVYVADDALHNTAPWAPEKVSRNPLLVG